MPAALTSRSGGVRASLKMTGDVATRLRSVSMISVNPVMVRRISPKGRCRLTIPMIRRQPKRPRPRRPRLPIRTSVNITCVRYLSAMSRRLRLRMSYARASTIQVSYSRISLRISMPLMPSGRICSAVTPTMCIASTYIIMNT